MHGVSVQVCRLDADGMCTAGLRMARHSGCYHVEFEVLQVTDGDGAYVGLVKADVNKSSYPGSDEKGLGWRAKGGVRHLHNTMDLGSSSGTSDGGVGSVPSWGQGDRVGFIFDTETLELRFVKVPPTPPVLQRPCRRPNPLPSLTPSLSLHVSRRRMVACSRPRARCPWTMRSTSPLGGTTDRARYAPSSSTNSAAASAWTFLRSSGCARS